MMCVIFRDGEDWYMHAVGKGTEGRKSQECVQQFIEYINQRPLIRPEVAPDGAPKVHMHACHTSTH